MRRRATLLSESCNALPRSLAVSGGSAAGDRERPRVPPPVLRIHARIWTQKGERVMDVEKRLISGYCKLKDNTDDALRKAGRGDAMSDCQICGHDIDNHGRSGCCATGARAPRGNARTDHPNYAEQDARIAALTEQVSQADRANGRTPPPTTSRRDETHLFGDGTRGQEGLGLETIQRLEDKIIAAMERTERAEGKHSAGRCGRGIGGEGEAVLVSVACSQSWIADGQSACRRLVR